MSSSPPRAVELLLESLGAGREFCDGVVGDLAEEFAVRASWHGQVAARRWYYREALRVTPHLLRDAFKRLGFKGIRHLLNVIALSYVCTMVLVLFAVLSIMSVAMLFGGLPDRLPWTNSVVAVGLLLGMLAWSGAWATVAGAIAASIDRRMPLVSSAAVGILWMALITLPRPSVGTLYHRTPIWFQIGCMVAIVGGATFGGILRVALSRGPSRRENVKGDPAVAG